MKGWVRDLALGVRLAVGGSRTSAVRIGLSAVGIACAFAVLLLAASIGNMRENRDLRQYANTTVETPVDGVHETWLIRHYLEFRGEAIQVFFVAPTAPDSPKPAALPSLPRPGEMYASPRLAELLRSADGELLKPRLPDRIVDVLPNELVAAPGEYVAWIGAEREALAESRMAARVYGFGGTQPSTLLDPTLLVLLLVGSVVLLLPVFVFISSASRIAGAERDRRLSALRLVGASAREVRRIAAGETLVGAIGGLVLGAGLFLVLRLFAEDISLFDERVYVADVVPNPALTVLIVLAIPALAVLTALFALRRTIIEPLGVVRQSKPVRRRLWWRLPLILLGVILMTSQIDERGSDTWAWAVSGGAALLLIGVPVLLPWLVERVAGRLSGGPPSWLLAIRRLQLDSGTSARVAGGVAIVLAGAIALQTVLMSVESTLRLPNAPNKPTARIEVSTMPDIVDTVAREVGAADGVKATHTIRHTSGYDPTAQDKSVGMAVLSCDALQTLAGIRNCENGDVFLMADGYAPSPGATVEWRQYGNTDNHTVTGTWTIPPTAKNLNRRPDTTLYSTVLITPAAIDETTLSADDVSTVIAQVPRNLTGDQLEGIRNAVATHRFDTYVSSSIATPDLTGDQQTYLSIRTGLYAGSVFTLLLAGISLLVLALEHIRERRRPLAALAASGVPRGVLGRSLLWQVALPIVLGTAVALVTGLSLATLVMRLTESPLTVDWPGIAFLCAGAITLSLLVSASTMPFLRNATRLTALRTE